LIRVALAIGKREEAYALSHHVLRLSADNQTVVPLRAAAIQAWGLVHSDAAALRRASTMHLHPWARASAVEDAASVFAARGNLVEARDCFEVSIAAYTYAGAGYDAARARNVLSLLGARRTMNRSVWGWASLTPTEIRVAEAVAGGLTNAVAAERMFLSRHTVDFHLRQIYRKLNVHSRVELTRQVLSCDGSRIAANESFGPVGAVG
jgi:DNA-binding CsgD family transcriptional regulator